MAIRRPDIYEHTNHNLAIVDGNGVRGGFRSPVADLTALYALSSKVDQLKIYSTVVYVIGENNYYELIDTNNVNNSSGWQLFMGTGLPTSGATNGLSVSCSNIILGGDLIQKTTINTINKSLCISTDSICNYGLFDYSLNTNYSTSSFRVCSRESGITGSWWGVTGNSTTIGLHHYANANNGGKIDICNTTISISNTISGVEKKVTLASTGLAYGGDYSSSYVNRSLVDKEYVNNAISADSNILTVANTGVIYTTRANDDYIGVSGSSCIYMLTTPICGQRLIIADICGNALAEPITIDGNGKLINSEPISTINTNYGAITYVYNGTSWSVVAFVN